MASENPFTTPTYRRNGKLQSCEPCRKGKLRCDHVVPACGRCVRRRKPECCVYHPAPLTRRHILPSAVQLVSAPSACLNHSPNSHSPASLVSPLSSAQTPSRQSTSARDIEAEEQGGNRVPSTSAFRSRDFWSTEQPVRSEQSLESMTPLDANTGFLGPTSYSAVFSENQQSLGIGEADVDTVRLVSPKNPPVTPQRLLRGTELLALLKDLPVFDRFTHRWFDLCEGIVIIEPLIRIWSEGIWSTYGHLLSDLQDPKVLLGMSEAVWQNTQRSMIFDGTTTAREWAAKATGVHLRWEVIGLVFSVVGLTAMILSDWDPLFSSGREQVIVRKVLARKMFSASDACLAICNELEVLNDMYLCLLYENSVLTALTKGDANPVAWQRTGELASALIAMGLHQEIKVDNDTPLFLAELRKKTFISTYGQDKSVATFLGRPPRLSARYCLLQLPLALSDTQVLSEGAELEAALASLDDDGWSKNGEMNRCTWMRAWLRFSRVREEILEISLGVSNEDIALQAEEVGRRSEQMWAALPAYLRFDPDTIWQSGVAPISALFLIAIYTDYLHNGFLLQRALIKRVKTDTKRLIPIARQMLGLVLTTWSKRDYLRDFQGDMVYMLSTHGLPSAGVLAVELLKQEQSHHVSQEILPRSEAIQDLSVFIAALASLGPGEGNYAACEQGRRALKRILDKILSPNPVPAMASAVTDQAPVADLSMYLNAGNDADFLQWLENMEWDKGPLLNTS